MHAESYVLACCLVRRSQSERRVELIVSSLDAAIAWMAETGGEPAKPQKKHGHS